MRKCTIVTFEGERHDVEVETLTGGIIDEGGSYVPTRVFVLEYSGPRKDIPEYHEVTVCHRIIPGK
jgi:hypothetical protein